MYTVSEIEKILMACSDLLEHSIVEQKISYLNLMGEFTRNDRYKIGMELVLRKWELKKLNK